MIDIMLPRIESVASSENYGRYHIEPLETGFGQTLGNALRRVLLSALSGAAVTAIRIEDVYHEFAAIPHIKEDTTELILNIKQIRLRSFSDQPVQCRIEASGGGRLTAADIICPPDVEVVNPEAYIATLDGPESRLAIELTIERGRGYVCADEREDQPIGVIPIDAIYTPVRKVNFEVEPTRVGHMTNYERLVLDVWTDGSISPDEAMSQASQILVRHLELLVNLAAKPTPREEKPSIRVAMIPSKHYEIPIEDLDLSVRAYNCLKRAGIVKVGHVLDMAAEDLLAVRNFGSKSMEELRERLDSRGLLENSMLASSLEGRGWGDIEEEREEEEEEPLLVVLDGEEQADEEKDEEEEHHEDADDEEGFYDYYEEGDKRR